MFSQENLQLLKEKLSLNMGLISDSHFGHVKVFEKFEPIRKEYTFKQGKESLQDFEKLMQRNWNVKINDKNKTLLHLGDFCIDKKQPGKSEENIKNNTRVLNGLKILIKGNHDKSENHVYLNNGWNFVIDRPVILLNDEIRAIDNAPHYTTCIITEINGKRIMFSHFGIHQYDERFERKYGNDFKFLTKLYNDYNCEINIHGHSHSNAINSEKSFNCSVEVINFTPKTLMEINYELSKFKK
jgi:calcineurin-like phosphoesterase family protein